MRITLHNGRNIVAVALTAIFLAPSAAAAQTASPPATGAFKAMNGYWQCTDSVHGAVQRAYVSTTDLVRGAGAPPSTDAPPQTLYGRVDGGGATQWEVISQNAGGVVGLDAPEGSGNGSYAHDAFAFDLTMGRDAGATVSYMLQGTVLYRIVSSAQAMISKERCTKEPPRTAPSSCAETNSPARTVHAAMPQVDAFWQRDPTANGVVTVGLVLNDRSQVMRAVVLRSPRESLDKGSVATVLASTFQTAIVNCRPVPAAYLYKVEYTHG